LARRYALVIDPDRSAAINFAKSLAPDPVEKIRTQFGSTLVKVSGCAI